MNIEAALIGWLDIRIQPLVAADRPSDPPEVMVTVERTGGSADTVVIDRAMIAVQCWARTRLETAELAYEVDELVSGQFQHEAGIHRVERNSLYNYPTDKKEPRYQIVYEITTVSN